jgi:hypothetical protein
MSSRLILCALLAVMALPARGFAADPPSEYATLLASLKAGNTIIDYARLRLSYMESPERKHAKDTSAAEKSMMDALKAKDYPKALKNAQTVLESEYVNLDAHFVAFIASRETGNPAEADFHRTVFRGLVDSIRNSGDGKSTATAWVVISVHEEYVVLRVLGFQPSGQSLVNENGHSYDVMKVKGRDDGSEQTFYFNVDIPMKSYL